MFHRHLFPLLFAAGAVLAAIAVPTAEAENDPMAACYASKLVWEAAVPAGDPAKVAALFTPDAVWLSPEGMFRGREEITRFIGTWLKPGSKLVTNAAAGSQVGDVVLCSGESIFTVPPGDPAAVKETTDHWSTALVKSGNGWINAQLTTIHPPQPQSQGQAH